MTHAGTTMLSRPRAAVVTGAGLLGSAASLVLAVEKYRLMVNPFHVPSCSLSDTFNCTQVMQSEQAALLGFPNPYLGLIGFAVVVTVGVGALAGARYAHWFTVGLAVGVAAALLLVAWLAYQSIVVIGALCPYCMVVWAAVVALAITLAPVARSRTGRSNRTRRELSR